MMTEDNPLVDILRTAIQREVDAYILYSATAENAQEPTAKDLLQDLATQELGHQKRLENLLAGKVFRVVSRAQRTKVEDLKITDYLVEVPLAADSSLQDVLIVSGKRENASHDLYAALSKVAEDEDTANLLQFLADEELVHKNRIETLYEELYYQDN